MYCPRYWSTSSSNMKKWQSIKCSQKMSTKTIFSFPENWKHVLFILNEKLNVNWGIFKTMPVLLWPVDYRTYPREYSIFKCHIHTYFYNPCITIMEEWTWLYCSSCDFEFHPTSMEVTSVWVKYWGVILPCYLKLI